MSFTRTLLVPALLLGALSLATPVAAQGDIAAQGRAVHAAHAKAVVSIAGSLSLDFGMGQQDMPINVLGSIVDADGLILTSLSSMNPIGDGEVTFEPQPGMELQLTAKISDLWVDLQGGERVPVETVLLDPLNDVAILRPKDAAKAAELGARALTAEGTGAMPKVLEPVVILGRTGEAANRVATARIDHVAAKIETPRECALLNAEVGSPVFAADGKLIGIVTTLASGEEFDPMQMMGGLGANGATVVNPMSALKPIIAQAKVNAAEKAAEPAEESAEEATEEAGG